jgi:formate-dependent nitrite reductase cytochrome c552 subunit
MDKLEKYYDKVVSSDVYLKVEKTMMRKQRWNKDECSWRWFHGKKTM